MLAVPWRSGLCWPQLERLSAGRKPTPIHAPIVLLQELRCIGALGGMIFPARLQVDSCMPLLNRDLISLHDDGDRACGLLVEDHGVPEDIEDRVVKHRNQGLAKKRCDLLHRKTEMFM
jgi:hypothetical protein